jgi:hypothetical protein
MARLRGFTRYASAEEDAWAALEAEANPPVVDESAGMNLGQSYGPVSDDGQPVVFTDSDGDVWSQAELDALAGSGTSSWGGSSWQELIDAKYIDQEAIARGTTPEQIRAENAATASNPFVSALLAGLGVAGQAGVAYIKAHPDLVPSEVRSYIPGLGTVTPGKRAIQGKTSMTTMLLIGGAAVALLLVLRRRQ